jgi:7,8-dihydropterin-6-yl-methyl-4-(beta-D-ribofuranosyl)aminobenzene 5'-phosphate synthase
MRSPSRIATLAAALAACALAPAAGAQTAAAGPDVATAADVRIRILSTMLADEGIGEWGFAALVEVDGYRLLFDTGAHEDTVLRNAEELKVDLSAVTDVLLSHHHSDHTGGLLRLRQAMAEKQPKALSRAHVAPSLFAPRRRAGDDAERNPMIAVRAAYEARGGQIVEHKGPAEIAPGVWLTGPVERRHPERNFPKGSLVVTPSGAVEDTVPEDLSLVVRTRDGLIVVTGCGHAGIGNILAQARAMFPGQRVKTVIGGLHLFAADEKALSWTAERMREAGVQELVGAHCTGIEAVYRLRALLGLERSAAVVGAVGAGYSTSAGVEPGTIAR